MKVFRDGTEIIDISIDDKTQLKQVLQGMSVVQANFALEQYFEFQIGDYIDWEDERYTILEQPSVKKVKSNQYQYNFDLKAGFYKLQEILFLHNGDAEFFLFGDVRKFIHQVVSNINRVGAVNYTVGTIPNTISKNLSFKNEDCLKVIQKIAKEFDLEYFFLNNQIHLTKKIGNPTNLKFEFKKGLRNIERKKLNDTNLVTRLYAYGGTKNITKEYGKKRLTIPYLEQNTNIFGVVEGTITDENIYPHRTGTVSAVNTNDVLKFKDTSLDFDVNNQLVGGVDAKITFNTGHLSGNEFVITGYDHTTKEFEIKTNEENNGLELPNETLKIAVGDKYVLHDIKMPQSYIDNAESELQAKAQEYLDKHCLPNVVYEIELDYVYLRKYAKKVFVGDVITIKDTDFGITLQTRILELNQSLANPYKYRVKVGKKTTVGYLQRLLDKQLGIEDEATSINRKIEIEKAYTKRRFRDAEETMKMLINSKLNFGKGINPMYVNAMQLLVGDKSLQFRFVNSTTKPIVEVEHSFIYDQDRKVLETSGGILQHLTLGIDTVKPNQNYKFWSVSSFESPALTDENKSYYFYVKANKNNQSASFVLSEEAIGLEEVSGYYHLLTGLLNSETDGERSFVQMYGFTEILPGQMKFKRWSSGDGSSYIELKNNGIDIVGNVTMMAGSPAFAQIAGVQDGKIAQAKNEAKLYAKEQDNLIQPTTQNLWNNSNFERYGISNNITGYSGTSISQDSHNRLTVNTAPYRVHFFGFKNLEEGDYIIAFDCWYGVTEVAWRGNAYNYIRFTEYKREKLTLESGNRLFFKGKLPGTDTGYIQIKNSSSFRVYNMFLGKGTNGGQWILSEDDKNSKIEKVKQEVENARQQLAVQITQAKQATTNLENEIKGDFKDGLVDNAEKERIRGYIQGLKNESADILKEYDTVYNDSNLQGSSKTNLLSKKNIYVSRYNTLISAINNAIDDGAITNAERNAVNNGFTNYRNALKDFREALEVAIKSIEEAKIDAIEVGGRNLWKNSNFARGLINMYGYNGTHYSLDSHKRLYVHTSPNSSYRVHFSAFHLEKGNYIISFDCWYDVSEVAWRGNENSYIRFIEYKREKLSLEAGWRIYYKATLPTTDSGYIQLKNSTSYRVKRMMLEKGTNASDWTLAPEDVKEEINEVKQKVVTLDYLKNAIKNGNTEVYGGLLLSNILGAKGTSDKVKSYMSGVGNYAFAAGVENFGTNQESRKFSVTHDGAFKAISGKIAGIKINENGLGASDLVNGIFGEGTEMYLDENSLIFTRTNRVHMEVNGVVKWRYDTKKTVINADGVTTTSHSEIRNF